MTLPLLAVSAPAPRKSNGDVAPRAGSSGFGEALGAASARADSPGAARRGGANGAHASADVQRVVATLAAPVHTVPPPLRAESSIELVLEGEWHPENAGDAGAPTGEGAGDPIETVETSRARWLTRLADRSGAGGEPSVHHDPAPGREARNGMSKTPTLLDQAGTTGEPAVAPSQSADSVWDATVRAVSLTRVAAPTAASDAKSVSTAEESWSDSETDGTDGATPRRSGRPGLLADGIDAETLLREFGPSLQMIEIAGFPFPLAAQAGGELASDDPDPSHPGAPLDSAPGQPRVEAAGWRHDSVATGAAEAAKVLAETLATEPPPARPSVAAEPIAAEWRLEWNTRGTLGDPADANAAARAAGLEAGQEPQTDPGEARSGRRRDGNTGGERRDGEPPSARVAGWSESSQAAQETARAGAGGRVDVSSSPRSAGDAAVEAPRYAPTTAEPRVMPRADHVTVDLGDQFGDVGRLRLSIKGPSLRATIVPSEAGLAARLDSGLQDLTHALRDRGFADSRVTVRAPVIETVITPVPTGREAAALGRMPEIGAGPTAERGARGEAGRQDAEQEPGRRQGGQRRERPDSERQQRGRWA